MSSNQSRIERLQRQCNFALRIYTDLAEATVETMNKLKTVPIPADAAAQVVARRIEEDIAQRTYLNARQMLMKALVGYVQCLVICSGYVLETPETQMLLT